MRGIVKKKTYRFGFGQVLALCGSGSLNENLEGKGLARRIRLAKNGNCPATGQRNSCGTGHFAALPAGAI